MKEIEPVITEKHTFDNREKTFQSNFLEVLDYQKLDARITINGFWIEFSATGLKFPIETLIHGIKPVVVEKSWFD